MSFEIETLYALLPAIYRIRDQEQGEPLKALLTVIAEQVGVLEADLAQLYDDQFIETCAEWVVPYLGDLVGSRSLHPLASTAQFSTRSEVANTIAYRRRKGTATMLEQLARDVTGWNARVVEFFQLLATTQYLNHLRPANLATPDLRHWQPLEFLQTPFATTAHTAEMRRISSQQGRYNIPNIGIFLWRLQSYGVTRGTARPVTLLVDGRYHVHPLGLAAPLFNPPQTEPEITHLAEPVNVPAPLSRRVLHEELEARRQAIVDNQAIAPVYFGTPPVFEIFLNDQPTSIPPEQILICNLSEWQRPPTRKDYRPKPTHPSQPAQSLPIQVAVDPVLGRLVFPVGVTPDRVEVNYHYGFSADMGGGSYDRGPSVFPLLTRPVTWQRGVTAIAPASQPELVTTLTAAINDWNSQPAGTIGVIALLDSRTYPESFPTIRIPAGSRLLLVAADWPRVAVPGSPTPQRSVGQVSPEGICPHLLGSLSVEGTAPSDSPSPGTLILNGFWVEGTLTVRPGNLGSLQIAHCTLAPGIAPTQGEVRVEASNPNLRVTIDHSISGTIAMPNTVPALQVVSSLIQGQAGVAIQALDTETTIQTSTLLGSVTVRTLEASNSLFLGRAIALRRQEGCVRFSFLAADSLVPRRYRCQPDLALAERATALGVNSADDLPMSEQTAIRLRVVPQFTSRRYGDPGYGQLSQRCAMEIRQGADDEAEMGVFHDLYQPQRETNLRVRLNEYLRFGLEAGLFYVT